MTESDLIPCLPENAPFTPEQRAYLNGFLAGLFSRENAAKFETPKQFAETAPLWPLTILFGSQTGTAENLAKRIGKEAGKRGFAATVHDLAEYPKEQLASESRVLFITSTYGDGEPPDNAKAFWQWLVGEKMPRLEQIKFSICALGDSNYPKFCAFGQELDARLEFLGAKRLFSRVDCDVDLEETFTRWMDSVLNAFGNQTTLSSSHGSEVLTRRPSTELADSTTYSRVNPFAAPLLANLKLNGPGSEKNTRHLEISLAGSGLAYEAGDALGVVPSNCPELVGDLLAALKCTGNEDVTGLCKSQVSLREALLHHYEITKIPRALIEAMADRSKDAFLQKLASPAANGELSKFLWGREIIDLLMAYPSVGFAADEFVALLKKLQPRLYSISSSPKAHAQQVHLTVGVVQYESLGRGRKGVCSTFLAERSATVPIFIHTNKAFRPPSNGDTPMIMVGPGTGIAPFRAFIQERRATGAKGRNWLFFGEQRGACDFLYRNELEVIKHEGGLTRLDTAFSRDQAEKVYVQDRMRQNATELFKWLEEGACFYVCGDASRMAKDVEKTLHEIVRLSSGRTEEQAAEYIDNLKTEKRYQRDVY